jgi:hypothetical protein
MRTCGRRLPCPGGQRTGRGLAHQADQQQSDKGGPEADLEAVDDGEDVGFAPDGESFYELPGAHHAISRNASATEPAKLLAVFVVDTDDKALTTPDK